MPLSKSASHVTSSIPGVSDEFGEPMDLDIGLNLPKRKPGYSPKASFSNSDQDAIDEMNNLANYLSICLTDA